MVGPCARKNVSFFRSCEEVLHTSTALRRSRLRKKRLFLFSTALMMAARYSDNDSNINTVNLLIDKGTNIDIQNNKGWTLSPQEQVEKETNVSILLPH